MFQKIKNKIKLAKISWIIFALLFVAMLISNIYLNYKVINLNKQIELINNN